MNKLFKNLQSLSSFAIAGENDSGKLTLAWFFASKITKSPVKLICPFNKAEFNKKKETYLRQNSNLYPIIKDTAIYNFKENWQELKNELGYGFLLKDIDKVIADADDVVLFHHIDEIFDSQDEADVENFLFNLITTAQIEEKKLIFTLDSKGRISRYIYNYFERNIDAQFVIKNDGYNENIRSVELATSLFSTQESLFSFELDSNNNYDLVRSTEKSSDGAQNKKYQIVLASDNADIISIINYLFKGEDFEFTHIEPNLAKMMEVILNEPDVIIFNPSENLSSAEFRKISQLVSNKHKKVIYISQKPAQRRADVSEIIQKGYYDVLDSQFHIEDLIVSLERVLEDHFYTGEMKKVPGKTYVIYDEKAFSRFIIAFLCKNLFFTVFKFKFETSFSEVNLKNSLGRAFDVAYINKKKKTVYFFLVNTLARNSSAIEAKIASANKGFKLIGFKDATKYSLDYKSK